MAVASRVAGLVLVVALAGCSSASSGPAVQRSAPTRSEATVPAAKGSRRVPSLRGVPAVPTTSIQTFDLDAALSPGGLAVGYGAVWITGLARACVPPRLAGCGRLYRFDPNTGKIVATIALTKGPIAVAVGEGGVFVLEDFPDGSPYVVARVDPVSNRVQFESDIPNTHVVGNSYPIGRLAVGAGSAWASFYADAALGPEVARFDARSGQVQATIRLSHTTDLLAINAQGVWMAASDDGKTVIRIDPVTDVASAFVSLGEGTFVHSLGAGASSVWLTHVETSQRGAKRSPVLDLVHIEATNGAITRTGIPTANVAVAGDQVWFAGYDPDLSLKTADPSTVARVDPTTNRIVRATHVEVTEAQQLDLAVDAHEVWVLNPYIPRLWSIPS